MLIDPEGRILGTRAGETTAASWTVLLEQLIVRYEQRGSLKRDQQALSPGQWQPAQGQLSYPAKVLADAAGRVCIADTAHHRLVVGSLQDDHLCVTMIIGKGMAGATDGPSKDATFNAAWPRPRRRRSVCS